MYSPPMASSNVVANGFVALSGVGIVPPGFGPSAYTFGFCDAYHGASVSGSTMPSTPPGCVLAQASWLSDRPPGEGIAGARLVSAHFTTEG